MARSRCRTTSRRAIRRSSTERITTWGPVEPYWSRIPTCYTASPSAPDCKNPNAVQEFQATDPHQHGTEVIYGHIHGSPVFWKGPDRARVYVWGENNRLKAYGFAQGKFVVDQPQQSTFQPPDGMPGGML